jgi:NTE family protein
MISPSQDLGRLAGKHQHQLPRPVRWLLRGVGALRDQGSDLVSYLLFEQAYCRELIELGFADTLARREEILAFLGYASPAAASQRA